MIPAYFQGEEWHTSALVGNAKHMFQYRDVKKNQVNKSNAMFLIREYFVPKPLQKFYYPSYLKTLGELFLVPRSRSSC